MEIDLTNLSQLVNEIYVPIFRFSGRFLVLYGGSGSGKSWAISQKIIYRLLTENNHNILCVRNTGNTIHRSQFALLKHTIYAWGMEQLFIINEADGKEKITNKLNGNQVIFSGLDDVEKLKSIFDITSVWIEESSEIAEEDFRELNRRLRGYKGINDNGTKKYMQFMISFNPISALHWLKKRFYDTPKKTLIWDTEEAKKIESVNKHNTLVIHSTYKDNRFIDDTYKEQMEELKDQDYYEYEVYALGKWGVTGHTYFKAENVNNRITDIEGSHNIIKQGYFEYKTYFDERSQAVLIQDKSITWIDDEQGYIKIYEDVKQGFPYVLGGDTAGEGSDWNVGQVLDNTTGNQVAVMRLNYDEDLYARQMYCLGTYYNTALIAIETNFSTHPMKVLTDLLYKHQYIREQRPDSYTGRLANIYGFNTNKLTRPDMLGILRTVVREQPGLINDLTTLYEMTTFIIDEKGKPIAAENSHDDTILSLGIAHYIRPQQRYTVQRTTREMTLIEKDKDKRAKILKRKFENKRF